MIKIGLVGSGFWADSMYLPALANYAHARVEAIAGNREQSTAKLAATWSVPREFWGRDAVDDMIRTVDLDAVIICSPTNTHYAYAKKALVAGLHVLCEKPLATSAVETKELCELAASRGLLNMVGFTYSWLPEIQSMMYMNRSAKTFKLRWISGFMHGVYDRRDKFNELKGNRLFADVASHMIHMTNTMFGKPKDARWLRTYLCPINLDTPDFKASEIGGKIELEYWNGTKGTIELITDQPQPGPFNMRHRFEFTKGNLSTVYQNYWTDADIAAYKKVFREQNSMARAFCNLIMLGQRETSRNFAEAHDVQLVLDTLYR